MNDLEKGLALCKKQCDSLNIPYGNILFVSWFDRPLSHWGDCFTTKFGSMIRINPVLRSATEMAFMNTLMHEVLHTCPGCHNHGKLWKSYAAKVNAKFGYDVKRGTSAQEKGLESTTPQKKPKYVFECVNCGSKVRRYRASEFTRHPEGYRCGKCNGKFKQIL